MARKRRRKSARRKTVAESVDLELQPETKRAISGIVQIAGGILLFLVLQDEAGRIGEVMHGVLRFFFGSWGILFPFFLLISGLLHTFGAGRLELKRSVGLVLCLLSFLGMMHLRAPLLEIGPRQQELAGAIGFMVSLPFKYFLSDAVGYTVLITTMLIGIFLAFEPDIAAIVSYMRKPLPKRLTHAIPAGSPRAGTELMEDDEEGDEYVDVAAELAP